MARKKKYYTPEKAIQIKKYQKGLRTYRDAYFQCMAYNLMVDKYVPKVVKEEWLDSLSDPVFDVIMEFLEAA